MDSWLHMFCKNLSDQEKQFGLTSTKMTGSESAVFAVSELSLDFFVFVAELIKSVYFGLAANDEWED